MTILPALLSICLLADVGRMQPSSPAGRDAAVLLRDAEKIASSENKSVLLLFSASWCGPCHQLQSFLTDPAIRPIFDRHFVQLIVTQGERPDDTQHHDTPGAAKLLDSLHDTGTSLPLTVILSGSGNLLADSVRPVYGRRDIRANIGYPGSPSGIDFFVDMVKRGAPSITQGESEVIGKWLRQHSGYKHP